MATVNGATADHTRGTLKTTWAGLAKTTDDVGSPLSAPGWSDKTVHVTGTLGVGGTVVIEGSNDHGATWIALTDPGGTALSFTAFGLRAILQNPEFIRPRVTAGDAATALTVIILSTARG